MLFQNGRSHKKGLPPNEVAPAVFQNENDFSESIKINHSPKKNYHNTYSYQYEMNNVTISLV